MTYADDSAIAFGVAVLGNAPITGAARRPNSAPNMILMPSGCMAANVRRLSSRLPSNRDAAFNRMRLIGLTDTLCAACAQNHSSSQAYSSRRCLCCAHDAWRHSGNFVHGQPSTASTPGGTKFNFLPDGTMTREPRGKSGAKKSG